MPSMRCGELLALAFSCRARQFAVISLCQISPMTGQPNVSSPIRRFSAAWCIGVGIFHFVISFELLDYYLMAKMASFFDGPGEASFWRAALWLWTPLAMATGKTEAGGGLLLAFACAWTCVIAITVGLAVPVIFRRVHRGLQARATPDGQTRSAGPGGVARLFTFGGKRRHRILIASSFLILEAVWGGWLFHRIFVAEHRSFTIRDSLRFNPMASGIRRASSFSLYEGLPHQMSEAKNLADELATKETLRIYEFPFYRRPLAISQGDMAALLPLVISKDTYWSFRGPKLCGGFHPDYGLVWSDGTVTYNLLICFGCHEMFFYDTKHALLADIREDMFPQLEAILAKYHDQRPAGRK